MTSRTVTFVIITYNNEISEIESLVSDLATGAGDASTTPEFVVVANDGGPSIEPDSRTRILRGHGNIGFAAGASLAMEHVNSDYVVFVNPDVHVERDDAANFIRSLMDKNGVVVPVLVSESGAVAYEYYEDWVFAVGRAISAVRCARFLRNPSSGECHLPRWTKACGAFVGMPIELARRYGPFDDAFFLYGEDRDLTRRLRVDRQPITLLRDVRVEHVGGVSGAGLSREIAIFRTDSAMRVAYRRYGRVGAMLKGVDLVLEALVERGAARDSLFSALHVVLPRWRLSAGREAPRLDFASVRNGPERA